MNTQAFGTAFGQSQGGLGGGLGLGLSFQDFPASQDNYLEFAEFSQVPGTLAAAAACPQRGCVGAAAVTVQLLSYGRSSSWWLCAGCCCMCRALITLVSMNCRLACNRCGQAASHPPGSVQQFRLQQLQLREAVTCSAADIWLQ